MDWNLAIESHRVPLLGYVAGLCAAIGLTEDGTVERVPKPVHRYVLGILRAAESAVRRLIVAAARDIVVEPRQPRPTKPRHKPPGKAKTGCEAKSKRKRRPLFGLFDPPKRVKKLLGRWPRRPKVEPRIYVMDVGPDPRIPLFLRSPAPAPEPVVEEIVDDGMVSAKNLVRRLIAVTDALWDIPRHAMRLARWGARPVEERHPQRSSPLRVGRPPGFRKRNIHEVDAILKECHWLARNAQPQLDTS
jgi:hypothetical protein